MDVRCDHCQTEYEFDDTKITEAGVTVKCTVCNHVFKVKRKAMVATEPVRLSELEGARPQADRAREREWKVKQSNGNVFAFKELTTLQKWIVERKVSRDDEISLTGESWKRLGNIAELASFFQVVEAADRATVLAATPQPMYPAQVITPAGGTPVYGQPYAPPPPQSYPGYPVYQAAPPMPPQMPPPQMPAPQPQMAPQQISVTVQQPTPAPAPTHRAVDNEPDDAELAAIRRGGSAKYVIGAIAVGVIVGAALFLKASTGTFFPFGKQPVAEVKPVPTPPPVVEPPKPPEPPPVVAVKPPEQPDAATRPDAAAKPEEKKPEVVAKPPESQGPPAGKSFDWYIQQAYRLRERNQAAAALALYEKAAELQPDSVEPIAGKAYCYVDLERLDEGIALFGQALARHPRFLDAIMGMAEAYKQKGDNKKAVEYYKRYVDQAPDGPEADVARNNIERLKE